MNFFRCEYRNKNNDPIVDMHYAATLELALDYCIRDFASPRSGVDAKAGAQYWIWLEELGYNKDPVKIGMLFLDRLPETNLLFYLDDEVPNMLEVAATATLLNLRTRFRPLGKSMEPLIRSGQLVTISPSLKDKRKVGQPVLCQVGTRYYLHKIIELAPDGDIIGNNRGGINGKADFIYGYVV